MSAFETTRSTNGFSLLNPFATFVAAIAQWNDTRATRKALWKLSDRELDDIGLSRGDIEFVASHG